MDAGPLSVRKIFGQDRRHVVPLFQRPYVWEREKQWEPFWEDVRTLAEKVANDLTPRPHFLGAIVLDQMQTATGQVETRQVIDGQQRLTTLQIFLEAFCDLCGERKLDKHYKALLKLTRNDDPMSEDEDEEFKVWPTNVDQDHFRRVMRCASPVELRKEYGVASNGSVGHPIADGYLYFHAAIADWLCSENEVSESRLDGLFNVIRDYLRLVVIDLDKEDDAQLIFETLNARGTPLLPSDLIKNYLFHRAQLASLPVGPLYRSYWQFFDEDAAYWRLELGRGHARRPRIDTFLQHYLALQARDEVPVAHLYIVFREFADKLGSPKQTLENIKRFADVYRNFDTFAVGSREAQFFDRLGAMDQTTAHPFLMQLFEAFGDQPSVLHPVLTDLESFLVRRMVCQLNTRGYNRLFMDLLKSLNQDGTATVDSVRGFFMSSEADSGRWPSDAEFKQAWFNYPIYRNLTQGRVRMVLEALEHKLRTGKSEGVPIGKLTIEHLLPQDWRKHWPLPNNTESQLAEEERDRALHTIGNLTLLTDKLNPAVSNRAWTMKRPEILKHTLLRLNAELAEYPDWDEACIRLRCEKLFDLALEVWPKAS